MVYEKLILLLLNVSVIFASSLKIKIILRRGESLTVFEIFILENFQCVTSLDF